MKLEIGLVLKLSQTACDQMDLGRVSKTKPEFGTLKQSLYFLHYLISKCETKYKKQGDHLSHDFSTFIDISGTSFSMSHCFISKIGLCARRRCTITANAMFSWLRFVR